MVRPFPRLLAVLPAALLFLLGPSEVLSSGGASPTWYLFCVMWTCSGVALIGFLIFRMKSKSSPKIRLPALSVIVLVMSVISITFGIASIILQLHIGAGKEAILEPFLAFLVFITLGLIQSGVRLIEWDRLDPGKWSIRKILSIGDGLASILGSAWAVILLLFFIRYGSS